MKYQFEHVKNSEYIKKETGRNFSFPAHLHQSFELIIVNRGQMKVTVDASEYLLSENESILVFPNQIHSLSSDDSEHTLFIFSPYLVQSYFAKVSGKVPADAKFTLTRQTKELLMMIGEDTSLEIKKGVFYCICGLFDEKAEYIYKDKDNDNTLYRMFAFVEKNFTGSCTLNEAAGKVGMNYAYLSRMFKNCTGMSFNEYVNLMRLDHACYLLENTNAAIIECALESGYNSLHTFERNFKAVYNMTPKEFRAKRSGS